MEIVGTAEIKPQFELECHCCTSTEDVHICELDNCDYPLCSTCKEKALKLEHKCPGCRRSIIIDISDTDSDSDDDSEPDLDRKCKCSDHNIDTIFRFLQDFIFSVGLLIVGTGVFAILLMMGRLVSTIFKIGPSDYWCLSLGEYAWGFFIGYGILGFLLGFLIICCGGGLLFKCLCSEEDGY
tara:strand:- start:47 stop:592 length:546 start_codon:yes stop_codon:yes gene_type:complete